MFRELPLCSHMTPGSGLLTTVRIAHYSSDLRSRLRPELGRLMKQAVYQDGWNSLFSNTTCVTRAKPLGENYNASKLPWFKHICG